MGGGNGTISAGSGYAVGGSGNGTQYGIYDDANINAGGGNIVMNGQGGSYSTDTNYGVYLNAYAPRRAAPARST